MPRLTYTDILNKVACAGYSLLDTQYRNNQLYKITYKCPQGHIRNVTWVNWIMGRRCKECADKNRRGRKIIQLSKISNKEILDRLSKENYNLIGVSRNGNKLHTITYRCPNGHMSTVTWNNWSMGRRCRLCRLQAYAITKRLGIDVLRGILLAENYILLSDEYVNSTTKFEYCCPEGHIHTTTYNGWYAGNRCPSCRAIRMSGENHPQWKGGISYEPYCNIWGDKAYKNSIKQRDGYKCQNPACWHTSIKLHVHHIDYDKKNCNEDNLITLCGSCNARANADRVSHTKFYKNILDKNMENK